MKVRNAQDRHLTTDEVASLPMVEVGEPAPVATVDEEELAGGLFDPTRRGNLPDFAVRPGPPGRLQAPELTAKEQEVLKAAMEDEPSAPQGRPSLEVAIETHRNLQKRVEALCLRIAGWSMPEGWGHVAKSAEAVMAAYDNLGTRIFAAQQAGVVAKTTPRSRIEARIAVHGPLALRDDAKKTWGAYYSPEELEHVEVVGRDDASGQVFVKLGKRENVLPVLVRLSQLVPGR